jgi:hypothetical protein
MPSRERGIGRPAVVARVQLRGLKAAPGVVIKAALGRQALRVEDIRPMRVTPTGSSDVDRHNRYSATSGKKQLRLACHGRRYASTHRDDQAHTRTARRAAVVEATSLRRAARWLINLPARQLLLCKVPARLSTAWGWSTGTPRFVQALDSKHCDLR